MIYTQAVILEVFRVANITQYLLPRRATADFEYKNFYIKKVALKKTTKFFKKKLKSLLKMHKAITRF